jgi:stage II sporulation protein M
MRQFYIEEWRYFREKYLKIFIFVLITYILFALLSHIVLVNNPVESQKKFMELTKIISEKIPKQATRIELCLVIFINNLKVSLFSILFGLIPFIFLPFLGAISNGLTTGIISSASYIKGFKLVPFLLFTIVPHGILELPSILYAVSIGIFLSLQISKRILHGHESNDEPLYLILKRIFKTWIGVIIPLLLVAAIIETFITPFLVKIFLER